MRRAFREHPTQICYSVKANSNLPGPRGNLELAQTVADLAAVVRRSANFAELGDEVLAGVLDMLSGRYPSDEFAELRPRLTWHRSEDLLGQQFFVFDRWPGGIYGAYKAAIEPHLKAYHVTYGMNTSAWRPAAIYGINPKLDRSQWYDTIRDVKQGTRISIDQGGKITHVQDDAEADVRVDGELVGDDRMTRSIANALDLQPGSG